MPFFRCLSSCYDEANPLHENKKMLCFLWLAWWPWAAAASSCPALGVEEVLTQLSGRPHYFENLGSCALVGASPILLGAAHGRRIDSFDTVVRVNRLPIPRFAEDVGSKTSIYFCNTLAKWSSRSVTLQYQQPARGARSSTARCAHASSRCDCAACPEAIVFEGAPYGPDFWVVNASVKSRRPKKPLESARKVATGGKKRKSPMAVYPTAHPVGRQSDVLHFFEHNVPALPYDWRKSPRMNDAVARWGYSSRPSGGLKAFFLFAGICDAVTLFGFGGAAGSLDGHAEGGHNFTAEERFLRTLADPATSTKAKLATMPTAFRHTMLREPFARIAARIVCLASSGRLALVGSS